MSMKLQCNYRNVGCEPKQRGKGSARGQFGDERQGLMRRLPPKTAVVYLASSVTRPEKIAVLAAGMPVDGRLGSRK